MAEDLRITAPAKKAEDPKAVAPAKKAEDPKAVAPKKKAEDPKSAAPAKKSGSLVVKVVVFAVLATAGWAGYRSYSRRHRVVAAAPQGVPEPDVKAVMHLEGFTVNLTDKEQNSFLRVGIDLGLAEELPGGKEDDELTRITPKIRDTLLGVLCTYGSEQLLALDGKVKLKADLLKALEERVPELSVKEVYFTDFLVQR
jgi:flagellar protein FliL